MPSQTSTRWSLLLLCLMPFCRCFMFGIGQNACRRLVQGLATVSKGTAEFLADGERLQPKVALPTFSSSRHSNVINNPSNLASSEIISQRCRGLLSVGQREDGLMGFISERFLCHFYRADDKVSEENHVPGAQRHFYWMALPWDQGSAPVTCGKHLPLSRGQSD